MSTNTVMGKVVGVYWHTAENCQTIAVELDSGKLEYVAASWWQEFSVGQKVRVAVG